MSKAGIRPLNPPISTGRGGGVSLKLTGLTGRRDFTKFFLSGEVPTRGWPHSPSSWPATSALVVCGGSGMDAEFLARTRCRLSPRQISSMGSANRARLRTQRHRFRASSPGCGCGAPAVRRRVLRHRRCPRRPAPPGRSIRGAVRDGTCRSPMGPDFRTLPSATLTRFATRFGLALETEAAGNRVARLEVRDVAAYLSARGFVVLRAERYAMYYPHHPGATFRLLSRPGILSDRSRLLAHRQHALWPLRQQVGRRRRA